MEGQRKRKEARFRYGRVGAEMVCLCLLLGALFGTGEWEMILLTVLSIFDFVWVDEFAACLLLFDLEALNHTHHLFVRAEASQSVLG